MRASVLESRAVVRQSSSATPMLNRFFPEVGAGGFARCDGTIAFYSRVNALIRPDSTLLDFGAGRGAPHLDDPCEYRRRLLGFRGKVARVIGMDVDRAVLENPGVDEAHVLEIGAPLPLPDASVDIVLADWVLEHLPDPKATIDEFTRVLRSGGWICARTPNRWHYQYLAAQLTRESVHAKILKIVQPDRQELDVFPKYYRLNDVWAVRRMFAAVGYLNCTCPFQPPPAYLPSVRLAWHMGLLLDTLMPAALQANLFVFVQKRIAK